MYITVRLDVYKSIVRLFHTSFHILVGITEENIEDVRWCLESTPFEKRVRLAARSLFRYKTTVSSPGEMVSRLCAQKRTWRAFIGCYSQMNIGSNVSQITRRM